VPKLGEDKTPLGMNGIRDRSPCRTLITVEDSGRAVPTLSGFADPGTLGDDESCSRTLLVIFPHQVSWDVPEVRSAGPRQGRHHDAVAKLEVIKPVRLQEWLSEGVRHQCLECGPVHYEPISSI